MRSYTLQSVFKYTFFTLIFALFGFQQAAQAQLIVINNTNCWVLVGEEEGFNCNFCAVPPGTWIAPAGGTAVFQPTCPTFGGQQNWIGLKFGVGTPPTPSVGPGTFSENTTSPFFSCGFNTFNATCGGAFIGTTWTLLNPNGSSQVVLQ